MSLHLGHIDIRSRVHTFKLLNAECIPSPFFHKRKFQLDLFEMTSMATTIEICLLENTRDYNIEIAKYFDLMLTFRGKYSANYFIP